MTNLIKLISTIAVVILVSFFFSCGKETPKEQLKETVKTENTTENKQVTQKVIIEGTDCFTVLKVKGDLLCNDKQVKENDKICGKDNIAFKSADAVAILHSPEKGRFTLKSVSKDNKSELGGVLASIISSSGTGNLSSRGAITIEDEFKGNYYVISNCNIEIDVKKFPLDNTKYFYLKFKYDGNDVNKKLKNTTNGFLLSKDDILLIDNKPVISDKIREYQFYYYDENDKTSKLISTFNLQFLDETSIKKELLEHLKKIDNLKEDDKFNECLIYINTMYGNTNADCLKNWVKINF